jgi:hypothetical protein
VGGNLKAGLRILLPELKVGLRLAG